MGHQFVVSQIIAPMVGFIAVKILPLIDAALTHTSGEVLAEDILERVKEDKAQLWVIQNTEQIVGVATTEVVEYAQLLSLRIVTLSGNDFEAWGGLLHQRLTTFARSVGATRFEAVGRNGLQRLLSKFGFEPKYMVLVAPVGGNENEQAIRVN